MSGLPEISGVRYMFKEAFGLNLIDTDVSFGKTGNQCNRLDLP